MVQAKQLKYWNKSIRSVTISLFIFLVTANSNANQQPQICSEIHKSLILREQGDTPKNFEIDYDYREEGMDDFYLHLDIDGDGIDDSVIRSCGASLDTICYLVVELSSGKKLELELEGERFFLVREKSSVYAIVGKTTKSKEREPVKRRVYQLTNQAIKLICAPN